MPLELAMTLAVMRGVILVLTILAGCLSLYLGWALYRDGVKVLTRAEGSGSGFSFKVHTVGPGFFFIAFGAVLILIAVNKDLVVNMQPQTKAAASWIYPGQLGNGGLMKVQAVRAQATTAPPAATTCPPSIGFRWMTGGDPAQGRAYAIDAIELAISDLETIGSRLEASSPLYGRHVRAIRVLTEIKSDL